MDNQILTELQKLNANIEQLLNRPMVVYAVDMGNLKQILDVPQGAFNPDFMNRLGKDAEQILNPRVKQAVQKREISLTPMA